MIGPDETEIIGNWIKPDGRVVDDETCRRVHQLTGNYLITIGRDTSGWDTLFKDPNDGRYWERIYLQGHMHGGGPPSLRFITEHKAQSKYAELFRGN